MYSATIFFQKFNSQKWCLKKHSEKTENARSKREERKRKKAGERASGGTRKSAAFSRLVTKHELARLARARKFVVKFWTRNSKFCRNFAGIR